MTAASVNAPAAAPLPHPLIRDRLAVALLLAGAAFGLLADWLFYRKAPGVSYVLFAAAGLGALLLLGAWRRIPQSRAAWLLAIPVLFFAGAVAVRAEPFLRLLNIAASLGVLAVLAYAVAGPSWARLPLIGYPVAALRAIIEGGVRAPVLAATGLDYGGVRSADHGRWLPVARGMLLALPVLLVFAGLFASADLVFNRHLVDLLRLDLLAQLRQLLGHGMFVLLAGWFVAGGLAFCLRRAWAADGRLFGVPDAWLEGSAGLGREGVTGLRRLGRSLMEEGVICRPWNRPRLGLVEAVIVLVAVDVLFLSFVGIQAAYLFGGQANIAAEGFTYAEYARRGFFELVAVSVLAMALALGLLQIVRSGAGRGQRLFQLALSSLILLVLVVLASAGQRLLLYEAAYGFTALRLYSHIFMAVLAGVFAWLLLVIWWRPERFAVGAFVAMIVFVGILDLLNPDAVIVRQNLARYQATGDLDTAYLSELSLDAVPALAAALPALHGTARTEAERVLAAQASSLAEGREPWQSRNLGRERARAALARLRLPAGDEP